MREHERESARDDAFEALLAQSVAELPLRRSSPT